MKIKQAIILAAGRGKRLGSLTNDNPKCMMTIKKQPVIERTIEVLKSKGIDNIIVVTGYKAEKLSYLKEKYNIKLIYNKKWENSNSIMSMYVARYHLWKPTLVIDSDIYIYNSDIIQSDVETSGYTVVEDYRPEEWQFHTNEDDKVLYVDLTANNYSLPILDISYWTTKDIRKIRKYISKEIRGKRVNRFWDEVPCFDLSRKLNMKVYKINNNDAMEYDTKEELLRIRRKVK